MTEKLTFEQNCCIWSTNPPQEKSLSKAKMKKKNHLRMTKICVLSNVV